MIAGQTVQRLIHRIERIRRSCEQAGLEQGRKSDRQRAALARPEHLAGGQTQFGDRHPVLGQRAGLVGAQHGRGAQCLDRGGAAGQHPRLRDPPGAHRHEHRQHHRKLLRQHRHADGDAGQYGVEPAVAQRAVEHHDQRREAGGDEAEGANHRAGLDLQTRRFGLQRAERLADLADLAAGAGGDDLGEAAAANHQRAGVHRRLIVAAGPAQCGGVGFAARELAHRHRLAGEQRLVDQEIVGLQQHRVGGDAVTLRQHHDVSARYLAPRNAFADAVADHQGTRAGEIAQRLQHAFGACFLNHRDHHRQRGEDQQDDRFLQIAERHVDHAAAEQQRQHRLAHHLQHDAEQRAAIRAWQLVVALAGEPGGGLALAEAGDGVGGRGELGGHWGA